MSTKRKEIHGIILLTSTPSLYQEKKGSDFTTTIPIFFSIDDKFPLFLDCAIRSIISNASKDYDYKFYVLHQGVDADFTEKISASFPYELKFISIEEGFKGIEDRDENKLRCDYFTASIFYRIFLADMFPEYDKGIYLDSDVIVPGDISELYEMDLKDNIIAACPDFSIRGLPEFVDGFENAVGVPIEQYINSGVLLMNFKMMRELHFSDHFLSLMNTYHFDTIAPDQDYINAMCHGRILYLDECWDAMPPVGGGRPILADPKIIHFNLFFKPWYYDDIPYKEYFWEVAEQSPFYQGILDVKASYSDEQKQHDQDTLQVMKDKAASLKYRDVTFKKVYDSGVQVRI